VATPSSPFEAYRKERPPGPRPSVEVRAATARDAPGIAAIHVEREGGDPREAVSAVEREIAAIEEGARFRAVWVALAAGAVVGYGRAAWKTYGSDPAARNAPSAWSLAGLLVAPEHRRRGVGLALTLHRLEVPPLCDAGDVWYFANARNRASLRLHSRLGFEEVTRDFRIPGVTFSGGTGILCRRRAGRGVSPPARVR
jgi:ribosomal protein S18 acetylase RimI-like enzyme